ncbi:MAG: membrane protein insertase YidC [Pseudomonadota bacterium]|nr:membrane protein insertase YidC [Pseudomonadota bacterium]
MILYAMQVLRTAAPHKAIESWEPKPVDTRNMILAVVLSVAIMIGFQVFFAPPLPPPADPNVPANNATQQPSPGAPPQPSAPNTSLVPATPAAPGMNRPAPLPGQTGTSTVSPAAISAVRERALRSVKRVRIESPRLSGSISLTGARVDDLTLMDYRESIEPDSGNIRLLNPIGTGSAYYATFGWVAVGGATNLAPPRDAVWSTNRDTLTPDVPVTLTWTSPGGVTFRQLIELDENYMFTVTQSVSNAGSTPVTVFPFGQVLREGTPDTTNFYILHEGLMGVFDGVLKEVDYDDIKDSQVVKQKSTGGWIGITDKYWLTALIPDQKTTINGEFRDDAVNNSDNYQVNFLSGALTVAGGGAAATKSRLFAGAKEAELLNAYRDNLNIARFDLAIDWGWFEFLTKPIFFTLIYFDRFLGNLGLSILLLTVLIKLAFFPLANKSYRAMSKMKELQPEMMKLRERFNDDKARLNQEMMALYKREKANPASGCLPILPQIPVFFALYKVVFISIEMRHAPFFGWIKDLSAADPLTILTGFGLFAWDMPDFLKLVDVGIWPMIMGVTMYAQQKLNPPPPDPTQAKIFMFLPFVFTIMLAQFPSGLVIYWAWNNLLSVAQQYVIMRRAGVPIGGGKVKPKAPTTAKSSSPGE